MTIAMIFEINEEKGQTTWNHHLGSPLGLVCNPRSLQN